MLIPWPSRRARLLAHRRILIQDTLKLNVTLRVNSLYNLRMGIRQGVAGGGLGGGEPLRVLVVQDHPLLGSAIAAILALEPDIKVCGIARTGADAVAVALRDKAAIVLMDFYLPDMSGPVAASMIRERIPEVAIVFHSAEDSEAALLDAIDSGATAYLTKSATAHQIVQAVRKAADGEILIPAALFAKAIARQRNLLARKQGRARDLAQFTTRELDVLALLAEGLDTVAMSNRLGIAGHTTEWHVRHLIEKLHVHSKLQAVIAAARMGLIEVKPN
jgi:two-component system, NarL family, response regulator DevR